MADEKQEPKQRTPKGLEILSRSTAEKGMSVRLMGVVLVTVAALSAVAPEGSSARCVPMPKTVGRARIPDRATVHARVGTILYVVLVKPAKYSSARFPSGFPWRTPTSSARGTLAPARLCEQTGVGTLETRVTAFRVLHRGKARLVAPLARAWRSIGTELRSYRATVTASS
jgi:hypothetical protein